VKKAHGAEVVQIKKQAGNRDDDKSLDEGESPALVVRDFALMVRFSIYGIRWTPDTTG
jgi:hypothetical protein